MDTRLDHGVFAGLHVRIDHDALRQPDRHACFHQRRGLARAENAVHFAELGAGVAPEYFLRVRGHLSQHRIALLREHGDDVGQVEFAVRVVGLEARERGPQFVEREAIHARVNFVDGSLLFAELRFLDDGGDGASGLPQNTAVAGGVLDDGGQNGGRGVAVAVRLQKRAQRSRADERGVSRQHQHVLDAVADGAARHQQGVSRAMLRLLQDCLDAQRLKRCTHVVCLMTHNGEDFLGAQRLAGTNHMLHERSATRAVQHFGAVRPQPRPFSRSQDDDDEIGGGHKQLILRHMRAFDNSGLYRKVSRHKNAVDFYVPGYYEAGNS